MPILDCELPVKAYLHLAAIVLNIRQPDPKATRLGQMALEDSMALTEQGYVHRDLARRWVTVTGQVCRCGVYV
jgi:hypothetical protein